MYNDDLYNGVEGELNHDLLHEIISDDEECTDMEWRYMAVSEW
jgi:hypothetical protein